MYKVIHKDLHRHRIKVVTTIIGTDTGLNVYWFNIFRTQCAFQFMRKDVIPSTFTSSTVAYAHIQRVVGYMVIVIGLVCAFLSYKVIRWLSKLLIYK